MIFQPGGALIRSVVYHTWTGVVAGNARAPLTKRGTTEMKTATVKF
jgi:hypothetical protein